MTEIQWRMIVRTFWVIVAIGFVVGAFARTAHAEDNSERKAHDDTCSLANENGVTLDDC